MVKEREIEVELAAGMKTYNPLLAASEAERRASNNNSLQSHLLQQNK